MTIDLAPLLLSSDAEITLTDDATLTQRVVPNGPKIIHGAGKQITVTGAGGIDPAANFEMENFKLAWQTSAAWSGATWPPVNWVDQFNPPRTCFKPTAGLFKLRNGSFTINVPQGAPGGSGGALPPSAWLVCLMGASAEIEDVTGEGLQPYGAGFLTGNNANGVTVERTRLERVHFPIRLHTCNNVTIEDVTTLYCSFGSLYFIKTDNLIINRPDIRYPGNGTQGDGINLCGGNYVRINGGSIIGAGCYGVWLNGPAGYYLTNVEIDGLAVEASLTSGLYMTGAPTQKLGGVKVRFLDLARNGGWGLYGENMNALEVEDTLFRWNHGSSGSPQHLLAASAYLAKWQNNMIAKEPFPFPPAEGVLPYLSY
jgi:hypothetical protein